MQQNMKETKEEEGGGSRINRGINLMMLPRREYLLQEQFNTTKINWESKMSNVTMTFSALFSVLFLLVGGIIGWLYQQHVQQTTIPLMHPEMFDQHGNIIPDEIVTFRIENSDHIGEEEQQEDD